MNQAYVKIEYIEDLTPQGFAALVGLLLNSRKASMVGEWSCTSPLIIAGVLTGKEPTDSDLQAVSKGFQELAKLGMVKKYRGLYRVDYSEFERVDEKYICLEDNEVRAILNSDGEVNRFSLLQYFAYLKSTFDFSTGVGSYPMTYFAQGSGKSLLTVNKYHGILERLGVLKIFRFRTVAAPGGGARHQVNVYCSPRDEEAALLFIKEKRKTRNLVDSGS